MKGGQGSKRPSPGGEYLADKFEQLQASCHAQLSALQVQVALVSTQVAGSMANAVPLLQQN